MSTQRQYDALVYVVGLKLTDIANQQLRATAVAAADGVLIGFVASVSVSDAGLARELVLGALCLLLIALGAATVAMWPAGLKELGSWNPALENDEQLLDRMCVDLSAVLVDPRLARVKARRNKAIAVQLVLSAISLLLLITSAFVFTPPPPTR